MPKYKDELKAKKIRRFFGKLVLLFFIVVAVVSAGAYFLFFNGLFDVRTVNVADSENLKDDLEQRVNEWLGVGLWQFTRRNNLIFISTEELASKLLAEFPKLEKADVRKNFPHALLISATERKSYGIWCQEVQNKCFSFDKNGVAFAESRPSSGFLLTNVTDKRDVEVVLGGQIIASRWFFNIVLTKELLGQLGVNVSEFIIPRDSLDEFYAVTADGWKIIFSNSTDIVKQISALGTLFKEKLPDEQRGKLQYVDLRIQDRIYYK